MNFLFVHQYFPGQYLHLARHLQQAGHNVVFLIFSSLYVLCFVQGTGI